MTYRLPSERVPVKVDDLTVEVERLGAWPIAHVAGSLIGAYNRAGPGEPELAALRDLYAYFLTEAQPTWDIEDHRGRIPQTVPGCLRLPLEVGLGLVTGWLESYIPKSTAADEVLPAGPVRDQVNAELKKARRRKG